jgi:hypothetical protein
VLCDDVREAAPDGVELALAVAQRGAADAAGA